MTKGAETWSFEYDANGMRTKRTNGTETYTYSYNNGLLSRMTKGDVTLYFTYDAAGMPLTVGLHRGANCKLEGESVCGTDCATYYYVTNLQGDVIAILDNTGNAVAEYSYDAWGQLLTDINETEETIYSLNPLLYRGYVYDHETGLYYLQSRYYNPEIGRFISADNYPSTGQGLTGNNMFAYCGNNPVAREDEGGEFWNFVIGAAVGGIIGGITAAVSSYVETGEVNWGSVALGVGIGAIGGLLGASGVHMAWQAVGSAALSVANNIGTALIMGNEIDPWDVLLDAAIGAGGSLIGSFATQKMADAAKSSIAKGIRRVISGKNRLDSGSRYWKGAIKQGMKTIAKGVNFLNTAQGYASVIGTLSAGVGSTSKMLVKQMSRLW